MNTKEVTAISLKILAIWLLVNLFFSLPKLAFLALQLQQTFGVDIYPHNLFIGMTVITVLFGTLACYLLFRVANSVLRSLNSDEVNAHGNLSEEFIIQIAGVFFLVSALISLPESIRTLYHATVAAEQLPVWLLAPTAGFLGVMIKFIVGAGMVFGASNCSLFLNKLRGRA